ncbi:AMP-binding protein [Tropicibacter naphthalenivorans]|uniref:Acetyl-coenzyme A synthetase n=1 Tax=Tropicibacter naphthalenivorans TaxID=441103 RepID=A0A0P1GXL9_9RHOB|nr:AMP-binding protein [Tropicibacter naphthalenivorans]CUH80250.1 Acetyl-coenzyme A synthetase [Tropicibacter naphthalenivorans]SMC85660.1 acetyl-CoA synthetase [Tropicibacter naphthalenivorans]
MNMAAQCLDHPSEQVAIIDLSEGARRDVTYGDLAQAVDGLARYLQGEIQPGDRVGVLLGQGLWCAAAHLAIWKIGAISVPLFKLFKQDALASRVGNAGCALVLTDAEGADLLGDLAPAVMAETAGVEGAPVPYAQAVATTPAVLIYTSGTTGAPKGALHGHGVLAGHLPGVALSHDHLGQPSDCLWTPADWAWIGGLFDVAMPALALGVPVIAGPGGKFSGEMCKAALDVGARNVFFPPTALRMLKAEGTRLPGLRSVASGGEPLGEEMLAWGRDALGVTINEFYGQTECNMVVSSCAADFAPKPGCIGKPVPGFDVQVIDADESGEGDIAVRRGAPSMMLEYWQNPQATAEKFRGDWLLTGDRGRLEGEFIRFVGRDDDVITSAGYRIGPAEIEDCLLTHPAVATVGVVGKPDALRTEIVKAYVVLKPNHPATEGELMDYVKSRLASYSYPREIAFLEALPMTVTGKVIRKELKARAAREGMT